MKMVMGVVTLTVLTLIGCEDICLENVHRYDMHLEYQGKVEYKLPDPTNKTIPTIVLTDGTRVNCLNTDSLYNFVQENDSLIKKSGELRTIVKRRNVIYEFYPYCRCCGRITK